MASPGRRCTRSSGAYRVLILAATMVRASVAAFALAALVTISTVSSLAAFMSPAALPVAARVGCNGFAGLFLKFVIDFALSRFGDIDAPTGQLGGQARVLSIFADGERQLPLRHRDERGVIRFAQFHLQWLHRTERVGDEGSRVWTPLDDVDFLVVEFAHNIVDTRAAHPNAGTDGVKPFLAGDNRHFGAAARLAGDGFDLNRSLVDFRYFRLEEAAHEVAMGARDQDLQHASLYAAHVIDVDAQPLPWPVVFGWHFLGDRHDAFHLVDLVQVKIDGPAASGVFARERAEPNLTDPVLDLVVEMLVFRFTNALQNDLLCRLGRDFREDVGRIDVDLLPQRRVGIESLCLRE